MFTQLERFSGNLHHLLSADVLKFYFSHHVLEVFSKEELSSVKDHPLIQQLNDAYTIAFNDNKPRQGKLIIFVVLLVCMAVS